MASKKSILDWLNKKYFYLPRWRWLSHLFIVIVVLLMFFIAVIQAIMDV